MDALFLYCLRQKKKEKKIILHKNMKYERKYFL